MGLFFGLVAGIDSGDFERAGLISHFAVTHQAHHSKSAAAPGRLQADIRSLDRIAVKLSDDDTADDAATLKLYFDFCRIRPGCDFNAFGLLQIIRMFDREHV